MTDEQFLHDAISAIPTPDEAGCHAPGRVSTH